MPSWYADLATLPAARDGFAFVQQGSKLWVLGGWDGTYENLTDTVYAYDPHTDAWSVGAPLSAPLESYSRGVVDGNHLYFLSTAGDLYRYDTSLGTTTNLGASGTAGASTHLALVGRKIYAWLSTPAPHVYDIDTGIWTPLLGATPYTTAVDGGTAIEHMGGIVVLGGLGRVDAWHYEPLAGRWTPLPDLPMARRSCALVSWDHGLLVVGGMTTGGATTVALRLPYGGTSWVEEADASPAVAGPAVAMIAERVFLAGGEVGGGLATDAAYMFGESWSDAIGRLDVVFPIDDISTTVRGWVDVDGGSWHYADVPGLVITGVYRVSDAYGEVTVATDPAIRTVGTGLAVSDIDTIAVPGGDAWWMGEAIESQDVDVDQVSLAATGYNLTHALGGGLQGSIETNRAGAWELPSHTPDTDLGRPDGEPPPAFDGYDWQVGEHLRFLHSVDDPTPASLTLTLLPELTPAESIQALRSGVGANCLLPLDAELCSVHMPDGGSVISIIGKILPTRLELARSAADAASCGIHLIDGPGLYGIHDTIDEDYRTEYKTPWAVISDMLMASSPRYWFTSGALHVDGRELPDASVSTPDPSMLTIGELEPDDEVDVIEWGERSTALVRFASSTHQGFMTADEVRGVMELYESGAMFELETDLLSQLGSGSGRWRARFDASSVPSFTPATPDGLYYYFDLLLLVQNVSVANAGTADLTGLLDFSVSGTGVVLPPPDPIDGAGDGPLPPLDASGTGVVTPPPAPIEGLGTASMPAAAASGTGEAVAQQIEGTGAAVFAALAAVGTGEASATAVRSGAGAAAFAALDASGTGEGDGAVQELGLFAQAFAADGVTPLTERVRIADTALTEVYTAYDLFMQRAPGLEAVDLENATLKLEWSTGAGTDAEIIRLAAIELAGYYTPEA